MHEVWPPHSTSTSHRCEVCTMLYDFACACAMLRHNDATAGAMKSKEGNREPAERHAAYIRLLEGQVILRGHVQVRATSSCVFHAFGVAEIPHSFLTYPSEPDQPRVLVCRQVCYGLLGEIYLLVFTDDGRGVHDSAIKDATDAIRDLCGSPLTVRALRER